MGLLIDLRQTQDTSYMHTAELRMMRHAWFTAAEHKGVVDAIIAIAHNLAEPRHDLRWDDSSLPYRFSREGVEVEYVQAVGVSGLIDPRNRHHSKAVYNVRYQGRFVFSLNARIMIPGPWVEVMEAYAGLASARGARM